MKQSDCTHYPKNPAKAQADKCQGGDISKYGLRVCLTCGFVGCCEDDPGQHAKKHLEETGHQVIASYPADKDSWTWCYKDNDYLKP